LLGNQQKGSPQQTPVVSWQALEAVARLRCSSGLDVDKYMGAFYRRTASDVDLPAMHSDQVRLHSPLVLAASGCLWGSIARLCTDWYVLQTLYLQ